MRTAILFHAIIVYDAIKGVETWDSAVKIFLVLIAAFFAAWDVFETTSRR